MSFSTWALIVGGLMITTALAGTLLKRLPLSPSMLYLAVGYALGRYAWWGIPAWQAHVGLLERVTEAALLISLFSVGLKLGLPLWGRRWSLPLRLALLSMAVTVLLVAAAGHLVLDLPWGVALILGGIIAPTDPVLASDVQVDDPADRDRLRFSLSGEGGLNDGAAFPVVMLGLGLLGLHDTGAFGLRWLAVDFIWALAGGLLVGGALGTAVGRVVHYLRTSHNAAVGLDEFVMLGLIALAYGTAQALLASGFVAVFGAGLAFQRIDKAVRRTSREDVAPAPNRSTAAGAAFALPKKEAQVAVATHPELAGAYMNQTARDFSEQLERIAELLIVLLIGFMLSYARFSWVAVGFVLYLFLLVRPVSVWLGLCGTAVARDQRLLMSWFGIRGIGSLYYLMFVMSHGIPADAAARLTELTHTVIAVSIVVHGISVTPLMNAYARRRQPHA
ncbi:MAG: cation:proton antiporter [Propionivibrio sp.]